MTDLASTVRIEPPYAETERSAILAELDSVLASAWFRSSNRCSTLLRFLVEETLQERTYQLRERKIATELFHRGPNYSSDDDPVVRVAASEVRKRLAQFYSAPENVSQIRIEVPVGSYVPVFRLPAREATTEVPAKSDLATAPAEQPDQGPDVAVIVFNEAQSNPVLPSRLSPRWTWLTVTALLILVVGAVAVWTMVRPSLRRSGFDSFWAPVLTAKESPLISIGEFRTSQVEIAPNGDRNHIDRTWMLGENGVIPIGIKALIFANSMAATKIAILLTRKDLQVELRPESETDYADLCKRPVVLIGPYDNDWTIRLTDSMRFRFEIDFAQRSQWIADRDRPTEKIGARRYSDYLPKTFEDDAIVARTLTAGTGHPAVILAGLTPVGTTSAAEFVSNPKYLNDFARQAPPGWDQKNVEFIIATSNVDGVAGPPRIVAYTLW